MKVRLKAASSKYKDLTPDNVYRVIGIEADDFRIMNNIGQPFLYPPRIFQVVDETPGRDWVFSTGVDGEHYAYPPQLSLAGFFEDYFDGKRRAHATLQSYLMKSDRKTISRPASSRSRRQPVA